MSSSLVFGIILYMLDKKRKSKLSQYVDTTGEFSTRNLKLAEWYLKHKLLLRKIFIDSLIVIDIIFVGYSLYGWTKYLVFDYFSTEQLLVDLTLPPSQAYNRFAPENIQIQNVYAFDSGNDKYDFVATVINPNPRWRVKVQYRFFYGGGETKIAETYVSPAGENVLAIFGVELFSVPTNIKVEVVGMRWERISPHRIADVVKFIQERNMFDLVKVDFTQSRESKGIYTHTIEFDITNNSIYSFWLSEFYVIYLNNQSPVGARKIQVEKFESGQTRSIELKSFAGSLMVTGVHLVPAMDIFDENNYMRND